MPLVEKQDQIEANVQMMAEFGRSNIPEERKFHNIKIQKGHNFVAIQDEIGTFTFAPSRFVGYYPNGIDGPGELIDGRETDRRIGEILRHAHANVPNVEEAYQQYCVGFGIQPDQRERKYWLISYKLGLRHGFDIDIESDIRDIRNDPSLDATQRERLIQARVGQGKFRQDLLQRWNGKCAVTSCSQTEVLRASHIKRWCDSNNEERLNPSNGLMLSAHIDALFEVGLISFSSAGKIRISPLIEAHNLNALSICKRMNLQSALSEQEKYFLKHHRTKRFRIS